MMAETSKIEWTDGTFNPWIGCSKVSPACDHCYAEVSTPARTMKVMWGHGAARHRTTADNWKQPLRWNDQHDAFFAKNGRRRRVFCASLADVFDNDVPTAWRMDLFKLIADTPNLDWLILTKRIGNVRKMCAGDALMFDTLANRVRLGATIANQPEADRDIPRLLDTPARVHFLSIEPLLGPLSIKRVRMPDGDSLGIDLFSHGTGTGVDWVIVGGESGPQARPMHPQWARDIRDECAAAGTPFLFKQWGQWAPAPEVIEASGPLFHQFNDGVWMQRVGKKDAGRLLDGVQHDGFPVLNEGITA